MKDIILSIYLFVFIPTETGPHPTLPFHHHPPLSLSYTDSLLKLDKQLWAEIQ